MVDLVVDLGLVTAGAGPHDGDRRSRGTGGRRARPRRNHRKIAFLGEALRQTLRGLERPIDCGDTLRRFPRRGLARARARAAPPVRRCASGSVAPAAAAEAGSRPREETARKAFTVGRGPEMKKVSDELKEYHIGIPMRPSNTGLVLSSFKTGSSI